MNTFPTLTSFTPSTQREADTEYARAEDDGEQGAD